jgi:hypothetical protein
VLLLHRYALAIDAQLWQLFDEIFLPNVAARYTTASWDSLATWKADFAEFHSDFDATQHTISNVTWRDSADTISAFSYGVIHLIRRGAPGGEWVDSGCWYDDEIVRTPFGLRIARRRCQMIWRRGNLDLLSGGRGTAALASLSSEVRAGSVAFFGEATS